MLAATEEMGDRQLGLGMPLLRGYVGGPPKAIPHSHENITPNPFTLETQL